MESLVDRDAWPFHLAHQYFLAVEAILTVPNGWGV